MTERFTQRTDGNSRARQPAPRGRQLTEAELDRVAGGGDGGPGNPGDRNG